MDVLTSKLITLCYAVFAVILCTLGYFFYRAQANTLQLPTKDEIAAELGTKARPAPGAEAVSRRLKFELDRQRERIDELQGLLDKRETILRLQASKLQSNTEEYEKLQREADDYLDMLFSVIQSSAAHANSLARLETAALGAAASRGEQEDSLESLRTALDVAQWEMEQSAATAEQQSAAAAEAQARLDTLQLAIVDLAQVSVPTLIGLLSDRDPEVRTWAAVSLGRMGKAANSALVVLNVALDDTDQRVRDAAAIAVREIGDSW